MALIQIAPQLARQWALSALRILALALVACSSASCHSPQSRNQTAPSASIQQAPNSDVYPVNHEEFADGPAVLRGSNSAWRIGAVPVVDPSICSGLELYILARPPTKDNAASVAELTRLPRASLALASSLWCDVSGAATPAGSGNAAHWYNRIWEAPREIGVLTITDVQAVMIAPPRVAGTIVFTTTTGLHGTFDLATERWNLAPGP